MHTSCPFCANAASDMWRVMCRDLYNLKKGSPTHEVPEVQELLDLIELPTQADTTSRETSTTTEKPTAELSLDKVASMFDVDLCSVSSDEENPTILQIVCKCDACNPKRTAAPVASATQGGQRADTNLSDPTTVVKPKHRVRRKTNPSQLKRKRIPKKKKVSTKKKGDKPKVGTEEPDEKKKKPQVSADLDEPIQTPVKLVRRLTAGKAYVLSRDTRHVAGQTSKQDPDYLENLRKLIAEINNGQIKTRRVARASLTPSV